MFNFCCLLFHVHNSVNFCSEEFYCKYLVLMCNVKQLDIIRTQEWDGVKLNWVRLSHWRTRRGETMRSSRLINTRSSLDSTAPFPPLSAPSFPDLSGRGCTWGARRLELAVVRFQPSQAELLDRWCVRHRQGSPSAAELNHYEKCLEILLSTPTETRVCDDIRELSISTASGNLNSLGHG